MPPPSVVICEICNGKFSKHSLLIHQKQCIQKRENSTSFCPVCDQLVSNDEFSAHVSECKRVMALVNEKKKREAAKLGVTLSEEGSVPKPQRSKIPESVLRRLENANSGTKEESPTEKLLKQIGQPCLSCGNRLSVVACLGCHTVYCKDCSDMIHEINKALSDHTPMIREDLLASVNKEYEGASDGRIACEVCERMFEPSRIAKHQLVCQMQSLRPQRKSFMSSAENRLKGTEFEKFNKQLLLALKKTGSAPPPKKEETPSKWRQQHEEILSVARAARSTEEPSGSSVAAAIEAAGESKSDAAELPAAPKQKIQVGDKVEIIDKGLVGVLQFKGPLWGMKKGTWFGIEFHDGPHGINDGSCKGVTYFTCPPNHGIFVLPERVRKVEEESSAAQLSEEKTTEVPKETKYLPVTASMTVASTAESSPPSLPKSINNGNISSAKSASTGTAVGSTTTAKPNPLKRLNQAVSATGRPPTAGKIPPNRPTLGSAALGSKGGPLPSAGGAPTLRKTASVTSTPTATVGTGIARSVAGSRLATSSSRMAPSSSSGLKPPTSAGTALGGTMSSSRIVPKASSQSEGASTASLPSVLPPAGASGAGSKLRAPGSVSASNRGLQASRLLTTTAASQNSSVEPAKKTNPTSVPSTEVKSPSSLKSLCNSTPSSNPVRTSPLQKSPSSLPRPTSSTSKIAAPSLSSPSKNAEVKSSSTLGGSSTVSRLLTEKPAKVVDQEPGSGTFSSSMVSKLRAKVVQERAVENAKFVGTVGEGMSVLERRLARNAVARESNELGFKSSSSETASTSSSNLSNVVRASNSPNSDVENRLAGDAVARHRDIHRNVDYLRVLAGEKNKLAAEEDISRVHVPFQGSGVKLGGETLAHSSESAVPFKPKDVNDEALAPLAKNTIDARSEREKRAAAALARINSSKSLATS